jgi:hypothetical protein
MIRPDPVLCSIGSTVTCPPWPLGANGKGDRTYEIAEGRADISGDTSSIFRANAGDSTVNGIRHLCRSLPTSYGMQIAHDINVSAARTIDGPIHLQLV